jgi:hypothetical protein
MAYAKAILAGATAFLGVLIMPDLIRSFSGPQKATGMAVIWAGLLGALLSPLSWIEVLSAFALLLVTSRLGSKAARVLLFWVPAVAITSIGCAVIGLMTFVVLHFRRQ